MKKRHHNQEAAEKPATNPVAKFAHHFNKALVYADKRKYQRKSKHAGLEPFSIVFIKAIEKGSMANLAKSLTI